MRILLIGDLHNEEEHIPHPFIPQEVIKSVDLIIQTGDCHYAEEAIDWLAEFDKPVFFIPGNHEYWNVEDWHSHNLGNINSVLDSRAKGTKIEILHERETSFKGVRFIGATLWTDLRGATPPSQGKLDGDFGNILNRHNQGFLIDDWLDEHDRHRNFFDMALSKPTGQKTVIMSHHFPSFSSWTADPSDEPLDPSIFEAKKKWYGTEMDHIVKRANFWLHGHTHRQHDYLLGKCRVACNPRGYTHEPMSRERFRKDFIIEI